MKNLHLIAAVYLLALLFGFVLRVHAQDRTINLVVQDLEGRPIPNLQITASLGTSAITDKQGKARLLLLPLIQPGQEVRLDVDHPNVHFVFIWPRDRRVVVRDYKSASNDFMTIVLARRGDNSMLENPQALIAIGSAINQRMAPNVNSQQTSAEQRKTALQEVAKSYGLNPTDLDQALRTWGRTSPNLYERAVAALYVDRYSEASELFSSSLKVREGELESMRNDRGQIRLLLGQSAYDQGKYQEALSDFRKALELIPDDANILTYIGKTLAKTGAYEQASLYLVKALHINQQTLGSDHPNCATVLSNLAEVYEAQGKYDAAEKEYRRALSIREKLDEHPAVAASYDDLGRVYYLKGRYVEASAFYKLALSIRQKVLGPEHKDVGTSLSNLAALNYLLGNLAEAEVMFERALAIRLKALDPEHPDVGVSLNNLATLYHYRGNYSKAEITFKRALAISEKQLGLDHPAVASVLNNLGLLYIAQKRYGEAEVTFKRALAISERLLGPDHPVVGVSLNNLGELYKVQGRNANAEVIFHRALKIREKTLGSDHPDVASSLSNIASLYVSQGKYAEAEPLFRRALEIIEKSLGRENIAVAGVLENYSFLLSRTGREAEASILKERAKHVRKSNGQSEPER